MLILTTLVSALGIMSWGPSVFPMHSHESPEAQRLATPNGAHNTHVHVHHDAVHDMHAPDHRSMKDTRLISSMNASQPQSLFRNLYQRASELEKVRVLRPSHGASFLD
jgi:hypothetical protein